MTLGILFCNVQLVGDPENLIEDGYYHEMVLRSVIGE
jgi:hypothetical protein